MRVFRYLIPRWARDTLRGIWNEYFDGFGQKSYSQEGEDCILSKVFEGQKHGFYVDVGAHHPRRFSNTYLFYKLGWWGINIDATPGSMAAFKKKRPRDINLELPISLEAKTLPYYVFNEPALNSFNKELSEVRHGTSKSYRIIETLQLRTSKLEDVLAAHLPHRQEIDFLNVDVEGHDMQVLESNDWKKYRPKVVLVEIMVSSPAAIELSPVTRFLREYGYEWHAKTVNTVIFKRVTE